jgi:Spy/CpxP family protein refolding chaperone
MKRGIFILLALSLGLNAGLLYVRWASPHAGPRPPHEGRPAPMPPGSHEPADMVAAHLAGMTRHLQLDASQQTAVEAILQSRIPLLSTLKERSRQADGRLVEAFAAADFAAEEFSSLVREASLARASMDSLTGEILQLEAAVLTPEQRARFAEVAPGIYSNPQEGPRPGHRPPGGQRPPPAGGPRPRR